MSPYGLESLVRTLVDSNVPTPTIRAAVMAGFAADAELEVEKAKSRIFDRREQKTGAVIDNVLHLVRLRKNDYCSLVNPDALFGDDDLVVF